MGFYTHLFFAFVALSHGFYVLFNERLRLTKIFLTYLVSAVLGLFLFTPWIFIIFTGFDKVQRTTLILLALVPALAQILPDLIYPSVRSLRSRYYLPYFLAIELAVAYLLTRQMSLIRN